MEAESVIYSYVQQDEVILNGDESENIIIDENQQVLTTDENGQIVLCAQEGGESQEVLIYDDESGELQKYIYIPPETEEVQEEIPEINEPKIEINEPKIEISEAPKDYKLNHSEIGNLQPGTLIQCNKCFDTFLATEFQDHYTSAHESDLEPKTDGQIVVATDTSFKKCAVCHLPSRSKKEYLIHYKTRHPGYKLRCPQCVKTYHSPELLQVHYKHFHERVTPLISSQPKRAHVLLRCEYCDDIVEDLETHLINVHELDEPTALAVTQDRPVQVVLQSSSSPAQISLARPPPGPSRRPIQPLVALHCNICDKDFATQREFTNHRRRKDFCKPLFNPNLPVRQEPKKIRRIGIIRKEIKK